MFSKVELLIAVVVGLVGGISIGYNKAREECLRAIMKILRQK